MYVYLLKHADKPSFKIGKAIDIHVRIPGIGGYEAFSLGESLCVRFPSEMDSLKHEKFIQYLFDEWNLKIDEENRHDGDTEHFKIECFDQVLDYLKQNSDTFRCEIGPVPPKPADPLSVGVSREVMLERRKNQKEQKRLQDETSNLKSTELWNSFLDWFSLHENKIIEEIPYDSRGLTISFALSEPYFSSSGGRNIGQCFFEYSLPNNDWGRLPYGVISDVYIHGELVCLVQLASLSNEAMKIARQLYLAELTEKIEPINDWIINRREKANTVRRP